MGFVQTGMKASEYKEDPWNDLEVYARKRFPQAGEVAFTWSGQVRLTSRVPPPGTRFYPRYGNGHPLLFWPRTILFGVAAKLIAPCFA